MQTDQQVRSIPAPRTSSESAPRTGAPWEGRSAEPVSPPWLLAYQARVVITDIMIISLVIAASIQLRFGSGQAVLASGLGWADSPVVALAIGLAWVVALMVNGSWNTAILGTGFSEYRRIFNGSCALFFVLVLGSYLLRADLARGYVAILIPLGIGSLLAGRALWRAWLHRKRKLRQHVSNVLVVGPVAGALELAAHLERARREGYIVTGICVPQGTDAVGPVSPCGPPVVGSTGDIRAAIGAADAHLVAVMAADGFGPDDVRRMAWAMEGTGARLALAPALTDVAGPRIHIQPVAGLPLMYVDEPRFRGPKLVAKTVLDFLGSLALLIVLLPVMLAIATAIKLEDRGPVFFRQERVGLNGKIFRMWKFRSMRTDAEALLAELKAQQNAGNDVMFKIKDDPRITRIGRRIRSLSLDELPQLINVLTGQMSLVGPRPPLRSETEAYERHVHRRFLVKPGITGLWQVSGRSDLSWEESVRLDLYYVENWSVTGDLAILAQTVRAVLRREGAY